MINKKVSLFREKYACFITTLPQQAETSHNFSLFTFHFSFFVVPLHAN